MPGAAVGVAGRAAALARRHPVGAPVGVVGALLALRFVEVLLLGSHRRVGALAASSTAALALAAGWLWLRGVDGPGRLAVDRRTATVVLLVGVGGVGAVQAAGYVAEVAVLALAGADPVVTVAPENPATKTRDPGRVVAYLLFGVVTTAVGEEVLFRRVALDSFARRLPFRRANALQAALFGAWHLAWPVAVAVSPVEPFAPLAIYALGLFVVTGVVGGVYGWLVRATGTVWTTVAAHLLHNGVVVFVHVHAATGPVRGGALSATVVVGYVVLAWGAWRWFGSEEGGVAGG